MATSTTNSGNTPKRQDPFADNVQPSTKSRDWRRLGYHIRKGISDFFVSQSTCAH